MNKRNVLTALCREELLHKEIYEAFHSSARSRNLAKITERLVKLESYHAELWGKMLDVNGFDRPTSANRVSKFLIMLCRAVFGMAVTVKAIEHIEDGLHKKFSRIVPWSTLSKEEKALVGRVRSSEEVEESKLEGMIVGSSRIFNNIRDIMFGMNDGLVELLAVAVGLAAAIQTPGITFLAGFIVAVSGTLSMAAGAYLSTGYQKDIDVSSARASHTPTPRSSAFYVGLFYFIGSLFPLSPFALGLGGAAAIIASIVVTSIVLIFTSSLIALASDKSVIKSIAKTLALSLGAAIVTIILGTYVRATFHITI